MKNEVKESTITSAQKEELISLLQSAPIWDDVKVYDGKIRALAYQKHDQFGPLGPKYLKDTVRVYEDFESPKKTQWASGVVLVGVSDDQAKILENVFQENCIKMQSGIENTYLIHQGLSNDTRPEQTVGKVGKVLRHVGAASGPMFLGSIAVPILMAAAALLLPKGIVGPLVQSPMADTVAASMVAVPFIASATAFVGGLVSMVMNPIKLSPRKIDRPDYFNKEQAVEKLQNALQLIEAHTVAVSGSHVREKEEKEEIKVVPSLVNVASRLAQHRAQLGQDGPQIEEQKGMRHLGFS